MQLGQAEATLGRGRLVSVDVLRGLVMVALLLALISGQPHEWLGWNGDFPTGSPPGYGYGLPAVYLATAVALAILYFPCRGFARVKARTDSWWTRFL